uniref:Putative coat protein n=1 Tax=Pepper cryptic virus 1 TaxID=369643 RepID=A0A2R4K378_9VIRU|nr:putative coat protein [Pepper cryptic virus 1]QEO60281.1 putative coat protein [Pepper cryptic virus 1]QEO60283.1 putative coat protein [Pepper cryptic virus 1]QEO60285.1 putative coat protein [Pepper cryptic virus 1]BEU86401.1 putative coat protein [Pepper cryptic virus 1]
MGDRVNAQDDDTVVPHQAPLQPAALQQDLTRSADYLLDNVRIGNHRQRYDKYRRYVLLRSSEIFTSLVAIYAHIFSSYWQHFRRFTDQFQAPTGVQLPTFVARVYISTWLHDLYCSIREATRSISPLAFNERYSYELLPYSNEYDPFLAFLSMSIKPTHIQHTPENTLWIPILCENYDWDRNEANHNPFGITNFTLNSNLFYGLLAILKERKEFKLSTLTTNTIGRPCWLFDWHDNVQVCAWFPREANFNSQDVTAAYIIGVACTPKLGPSDDDAWKYYASLNSVPTFTPTEPRLTNRRSYGAYEVRTRETENNYFLPDSLLNIIEDFTATGTTQRRKIRRPSATSASTGAAIIIRDTPGTASTAPTSTTEIEVTFPPVIRTKIRDWYYHSRVILELEDNSRTAALRMFIIA